MIEYKGIFETVMPFGYGCGRLILIRNKTGKKIFPVHWKQLTKQRLEKNIEIGDKIKIEYEDMKNFKIEEVKK